MSYSKVTREPEILANGKRFHKLVQDAWEDPADPTFGNEHFVRLEWPIQEGRKTRTGRIDVIFELKDKSAMCLFEIKATNWDRVRHVERLLGSHRRQLMKYVDQFLLLKDIGVVASMIYPNRPSAPELGQRVEDYMGY